MGDWVDDPDWGSAVGERLRRRLVDVVDNVDDIRPIVQAVGLQVGHHPFGANAVASSTWESVTEEAGRLRVLRRLLEYVATVSPALQPDVDHVLAASRGGGAVAWYRSNPPETARLLGPGERRSLIARVSLGPGLLQVTGNAGMLVMAIRGDKGMGKSHTRWLLNHILEATRSPWAKVEFDIAAEFPPEDYVGTSERVSVSTFVDRLASIMGSDFRSHSVPDPGDEPRYARELAAAFAGRYAVDDFPRRVLFLDGLDRLYLSPGVAIVVSHLATKVVHGDLPRLRLVVTGYQGAFNDDVLDALVEDRAVPLMQADLEEFFRTVGRQVSRQPTPQEVTAMVAETLQSATLADHATLGRAASAVARRQFGPRP